MTSLRASNSGGTGQSKEHMGVQDVDDAVVMNDVSKEDWKFDGVMTPAEAKESGFRGNVCALQTKYLAVHIELSAGFIDVVQNGKL